MPDTADRVRAMAEMMLDEELLLILDRLADATQLTLLQQEVLVEARRRGLQR